MRQFDMKEAARTLELLAHTDYTKMLYITSIKHVSRSGMSRDIVVGTIIIREGKECFVRLGEGRVRGCGFDVSQHVLSEIFRELNVETDVISYQTL